MYFYYLVIKNKEILINIKKRNFCKTNDKMTKKRKFEIKINYKNKVDFILNYQTTKFLIFLNCKKIKIF